jgi:hypothetical protein
MMTALVHVMEAAPVAGLASDGMKAGIASVGLTEENIQYANFA